MKMNLLKTFYLLCAIQPISSGKVRVVLKVNINLGNLHEVLPQSPPKGRTPPFCLEQTRKERQCPGGTVQTPQSGHSWLIATWTCCGGSLAQPWSSVSMSRCGVVVVTKWWVSWGVWFLVVLPWWQLSGTWWSMFVSKVHTEIKRTFRACTLSNHKTPIYWSTLSWFLSTQCNKFNYI